MRGRRAAPRRAARPVVAQLAENPDPTVRRRFTEFQATYEKRYAPTFGRFRLPLIVRAASAFRLCGDWSQGLARIWCPKCGFDRFRLFSCKGYLRKDHADSPWIRKLDAQSSPP